MRELQNAIPYKNVSRRVKVKVDLRGAPNL
jgi:hypothetical protein